MKQKNLILTVLIALITMTSYAANEPYAVLSNDDTVLTFYYDGNKASRGGMGVGPFNYYSHSGWSDKCNSITTVVFDDSFANCNSITSTYDWFSGCRNLTTITGIENLKTDNVTIMSFMFMNCSSLTSLDLSSLNICKVTSMGQVFYGCSNLKSIKLFNFDNISVKVNIAGLFQDCASLTNIDLSGLKTDCVTSMSGMFRGCSGLTSLDVSNFNTENVTDMSGMFFGCSGLTALDLSNFNTENVKDMNNMFQDCRGLLNLNVSNFNTSNVTNMSHMFYSCSGLTSLDVSSFNTENVTDMSGMFLGCSGLTSLDVSSFNTENVTDMSWMFFGCSNLASFDLSILNTENVTNMEAMFASCSVLTSMDLSNVMDANISRMFEKCNNLTMLILGGNITQFPERWLYDISSLVEVVSKIENPTAIDYYVFSNNTTLSGKLYVPKGTIDKYKDLEGWKRFKNIRDVAPGEMMVGDVIIVDGISYMVTSTSPEEVQVGGIRSGNYYYAVDNTTAQTLASVEIPESVVGTDNKTYAVTGFNNGAFYNCKALQEIHSKQRTPNPISSNIFPSSIYETATLYVPVGSMAFYKGDTYGWNKFTNIVIDGADIDKSLAAGEVFTVDDVNYLVTSPFEVEVGNTSTIVNVAHAIDASRTGALEIPSVVTGPDGNQYTVSSIQARAFYGCGGLTSITLPNTIASIGSYALSRCDGLTSITIPKNVISIEGNPISYCPGLASIVVERGNHIYDSRDNCNAIINTRENSLVSGCKNTIIPTDVVSFGQSSMAGITAMTSFTFPEGCKSVNYFMFAECTNLKSVKLPSTLQTIEHGAFEDCSNLESIFIPKSVTLIKSNVFENCGALTSIVVEEGNTIYDSRDNCNAIIKTETHELLHGSNKTIIPNTVTAIGNNAFYGRSSLTAITIPNSVTSIGTNAFTRCTNLTSISIPNSITSIGMSTFADCISLTSITIPNSVTSIGTTAFYGCTSLTTITIPNSVISIGSRAFENCKSLAAITIPNLVTNIESRAFYNCNALVKVVSEINEPYDIDKDVFNRIDKNATLYIPVGTKEAYMSKTGWKEFANIEEMGLEDINGDGTTDSADIIEIVNYITGNPSDGFDEKAADVNGDGVVDIADIIQIVNDIIGK